MRPALSIKRWRDAWRMRGLIAAAAAVLAAGIALYVMAAGTLASLADSREAYYAQQGMAHVQAQARRAPLALLPRIRSLPGVARADARLTGAGILALEGFAEPVNAIVHSLGEDADGGLNAPYLLHGRWPDRQATSEAVVNEAFARAHGLQGGDRIGLVIRGAMLDLRITGTAQAPDHVYTVPPGALTSDDRRLAVIWMPRRALEGPLDQQGAFSELLLLLERDARPALVVRAVDRLLAPYGGTGAVPLEDQMSDRFLTSEMDQLAVMARVLPPAFLAVAAFLLWVMVGRLIATEREQIGLLKAFGYRDHEVGLHYARLGMLVSVLGIAIGILAGRWLGRSITAIYADFYQFPILLFRTDPRVMIEAATIGLLAGLLGVIAPVRRAMRLAPAAAMQPPRPPSYGKGWAAAIGGLGLLDSPGRMLVRQVLRFPGRSMLAGVGVALALALAIGTSFNTDAVARMIDIGFNQANRQTATIVFADVRPASTVQDLGRLPGVMAVQPFRVVPARLAHGQHRWRDALTGLPPAAAMVRPLDADGRPVTLPAQGVVISQTLADRLNAGVGTVLTVEVLDGARPVLPLRVAAVVKTYQGTPAWIALATLNRELMEGPVISGAWLQVDPDRRADLLASLEGIPMVASVTLRSSIIDSFEEQVTENLGVFRIFSLGLAAIIVIGVMFTNARLGLTEQGRALATMRVLGYRPREVRTILIGGLLLITIIAIPFGIGLGLIMAWRIALAFSSDMYTIPFAVSTATVGLASLSTLVAAVLTAVAVAQRLNRLDLVRALKAPE